VGSAAVVHWRGRDGRGRWGEKNDGKGRWQLGGTQKQPDWKDAVGYREYVKGKHGLPGLGLKNRGKTEGGDKTW